MATETQLHELFRTADRRAESLHASPDGRSVVAVVRTAEVDYRRDFVGLGARVLYLVDLQTHGVRALTDAAEDAHAPAWSPDGTRLAFLTSASELMTLHVATGARTLHAAIAGKGRNRAGADAEIVWSSDGRSIAYSVQPDVPWSERFVDRSLHGPATLAGPIVVDGTSTDAPLLRAQGMEGAFFGETRRELRVAERSIASVNEDARLLSFSGGEIVVCNGSAIESLPSARRIAGVDGAIVYARATGAGSWLLLSRKETEWIAWSLRGETVRELGRTIAEKIVAATADAFIGVEDRGATDRLVAIDFRSGRQRTLLADMVVRRTTVAGDRVLAAAVTATAPESLYLIDTRARAAPVRVASWAGATGAAFGGIATRLVRWQSDGATIEGLLVSPLSPGPKPLPTLLFLHGGPESRATANAHELHHPLGGYAAIMARAGYAVLLPNFRNGKELGNGKLFATPAADVLAGVARLVEEGVADPARLGVYGFSYGSMLAAWIVARDHRFRAAVVSVGTLDLLTDDRTRLRGDRAYHAYAPDRAGPEDHLLDHWLAPEKYRELSPLERARDVRTPVLLVSTAAEHLAGHDYPAYFNALRVNRVPVQWIYYPAAWHGGSWSIEDRVDNVTRLLQWFEKWLR